MNTAEYTRGSYLDAYHELLRTAKAHGLPEEVGKMLAKELGSEKSIRRMTAYFRQAHPTSMEQIADELMAIVEEKNRWIQKKEAEKSNNRYSAWLSSETRMNLNDED